MHGGMILYHVVSNYFPVPHCLFPEDLSLPIQM